MVSLSIPDCTRYNPLL